MLHNWGQELSGMLDWKFGGKSSFKDLINYMNRNADDDRAAVEYIADYFKSVGEDPSDYIDSKTMLAETEEFYRSKSNVNGSVLNYLSKNKETGEITRIYGVTSAEEALQFIDLESQELIIGSDELIKELNLKIEGE